jgi:hypothetical protein
MNMQSEFLDGDILKISVNGNDILFPILGASFHLKYPSEDLSFLKYEPGEFFERGGDPFYLVKNNENSGEIIFGETLRRDDEYPIGSGLISDFYFQIINDVEFDFSFDSGVLSGVDSVRQDLNQIAWESMTTSRNGVDSANSPFSLSKSLLDSTTSFDYSTAITVLLFIFALCVAVYMIVFLRNQEKKRHESYVNFK